MTEEPIDYPERPDDEQEREMIAEAESNAPASMLRAQREWDRRASQR